MISSDITNNIINCNFDHYNYLTYAANICKNNHENDFYTAIVDTKIKKDYIYNRYIYSDINNTK